MAVGLRSYMVTKTSILHNIHSAQIVGLYFMEFLDFMTVRMYCILLGSKSKRRGFLLSSEVA